MNVFSETYRNYSLPDARDTNDILKIMSSFDFNNGRKHTVFALMC